jgi:hypothetical protein
MYQKHHPSQSSPLTSKTIYPPKCSGKCQLRIHQRSYLRVALVPLLSSPEHQILVYSKQRLVLPDIEMAVKLIKQTIESQYLDLEKLSDKLAKLFPGVDCEVEPIDGEDYTILTVPRKLTEDEIKSVLRKVTE